MSEVSTELARESGQLKTALSECRSSLSSKADELRSVKSELVRVRVCAVVVLLCQGSARLLGVLALTLLTHYTT